MIRFCGMKDKDFQLRSLLYQDFAQVPFYKMYPCRTSIFRNCNNCLVMIRCWRIVYFPFKHYLHQKNSTWLFYYAHDAQEINYFVDSNHRWSRNTRGIRVNYAPHDSPSSFLELMWSISHHLVNILLPWSEGLLNNIVVICMFIKVILVRAHFGYTAASTSAVSQLTSSHL